VCVLDNEYDGGRRRGGCTVTFARTECRARAAAKRATPARRASGTGLGHSEPPCVPRLARVDKSGYGPSAWHRHGAWGPPYDG
jgi:hypothetical protein